MSQQQSEGARRAAEIGRQVTGAHLVQAPPPTDVSTTDTDAGRKVRWWLLALLVGLATWAAAIYAVVQVVA